MSAMLYTHTAEPRKMELGMEGGHLCHEFAGVRVGPMMAGRTLNRPGGGEEGVDDRVLFVPGREQKNVL